jgi:integrase
MVRVGSRRKRVPVPLTAEGFRALFAVLPERERLLGMICATAGMRIGEVLGLKWEDINFPERTANVLRSFVDGSVGRCKTEVSQQPVPLDDIVLEGIQAWGSISLCTAEKNWIFASYQTFGKAPMWPDSLRRKVLQPAAPRVGIATHLGWHTFRHTYSSLLADNGNDVKVVQELMRHAKLSTTMEVYTHARMEKSVWLSGKPSMCCLPGNRDSNRRRGVSVPICSHGVVLVPRFCMQVIGKIGGPGRDRTDDLFHAMEARSQLRHRPISTGWDSY